MIRIADFFPDLHARSLDLGEHERPFLVLAALQQGIYLFPHLGGYFPIRCGEFCYGNLALTFIADIHHDKIFGDGNYAAPDHLPLLNPAQTFFVDLGHLLNI